jgi:hypothetical protein
MGLRADKIVILVRHPYSVIASRLSGKSAGVMGGDRPERRAEWYAHYRDSDYVRTKKITLEAVRKMPFVEFLAISWLLQNLDYMRMAAGRGATIFGYEKFLSDPGAETRKLYELLDLEITQQVRDFLLESTSSSEVSLFRRDASNEFYSVFRGKSFDPKKWKKTLSIDDARLIDKHCGEFVAELGIFDLSNFII